jgi:glycerol kinase
MTDPLILAIDQGTTGTTTGLYDQAGRSVKQAYREIPQRYPQPGWVEHDPEALWQSVVDTVAEATAGVADHIAAVGITNQRETTVLWDAASSRPLHPAIVWQCRRTSPACAALQAHAADVRERTGLPLDAYFSATKMRWLLEHVAGADRATARVGTVDSWLIWKLTSGQTHATDVTNASRTLLLNLKTQRWDPELLRLFGVPAALLPEVRPSLADYGRIDAIPALRGVPILGVAGDQQAALFGQACFQRGQIKNTYGTGCFLLMNTGAEPVRSARGLITTLAIGEAGQPCYALEGSVFVAGAAVQWLRDGLGLIRQAGETAAAALAVPDNGGVYMVPAFVGLGAPHWDSEARGAIVGITRGSRREHLIRAALESIAYQTHDVFTAMEQETGTRAAVLAVDGGACANDFLMQFQADILGRQVLRPTAIESTSRGAAWLAGLHAGVWRSTAALADLKACERAFTPTMADTDRNRLLAGWQKALRQTLTR